MFEQENQLCLPKRTTLKYFGFPSEKTRDRTTPHFGQIYRLNYVTRNKLLLQWGTVLKLLC